MDGTQCEDSPPQHNRESPDSLQDGNTQEWPDNTGTKVLSHLIIGIDKGHDFLKVAWGSYQDGHDPASIIYSQIEDIKFSGSPDYSVSRLAPAESSYPTSDDDNTGIYHGWSAREHATTNRRRNGRVANFKPRTDFPSTANSWTNIPDAPGTVRADSTDEWPSSLREKLPYLKRKGFIKCEEEVDVNYFTYVFNQIKESESGPFEAGLKVVSPKSRITIVVGCPVTYGRRTRETMKRIVSRAAKNAGVGELVPVSIGKLDRAENLDFWIDQDYSHDLTNVYFTTEPSAALLYCISSTLTPRTMPYLVSRVVRLVTVLTIAEWQGCPSRRRRCRHDRFGCLQSATRSR
jgi:hypothetical protein